MMNDYDIEKLRLKLFIFDAFRDVDVRFGIVWEIPYDTANEAIQSQHGHQDCIPTSGLFKPHSGCACRCINELALNIQKLNGGPFRL
jgi:hypothetical protein